MQPPHEHACAIRHAAAAVGMLSGLASEMRVALALARDQAEKVRVQRLRFARCGVLVNPYDTIADSAPTTSALLLRGARSAATAGAAAATATAPVAAGGSTRFPTPAKGEPHTTTVAATAAGAAMATAASVSSAVGAAGAAAASVVAGVGAAGASAFLGGVLPTSMLQRAFGVASTVSRIAAETTDALVDNATSAAAAAATAASATLANVGRGSAPSRVTSAQAVAANTAAAARLTDKRSLTAAASQMNAVTAHLDWRRLAVQAGVTQAASGTGEGADEQRRALETQLGLRVEHAALETRQRDESASAARSVEASIRELGVLTTILQEQVSLQAEQMLLIERNTDESAANVARSRSELAKSADVGFWSFKRIIAAIVWAHTLALLLLHFIIR